MPMMMMIRLGIRQHVQVTDCRNDARRACGSGCHSNSQPSFSANDSLLVLKEDVERHPGGISVGNASAPRRDFRRPGGTSVTIGAPEGLRFGAPEGLQ
eukprot:11999911-Karenia_brevis.AAC.1